MGLDNYEQLSSNFALTNVLDSPARRRSMPARRSSRRSAPGDEFDVPAARERGKHLMVEIAEADERYIVVACGHAVFKALTGQRTEFFRGNRVEGVEVWCFPHPSGASTFWNDRKNVDQASRFLKRLLE